VLPSLLLVAHLVGLALGVGAASAKLLLLLKTRLDGAFVPPYIEVAGSVTRLIQVGLVLLTLSGIGWIVLGYPVTSRLAAKLVLVGAIWVMGPVIDKVLEPRFRQLGLASGAVAAAAFVRVRRQYIALETAATSLFYAVIVYWVLVPR
jgi:hypothetical protein